jgi:hypothetical protein
MDENIRQKLNRVYGRGFYDGVQAANEGATKEPPMTESKFNSIFRGISEQAKKVYHAVPIEDSWSVTQIMAELARTTGQRDHRIVSGCLNSLKSAGLVRELPNNTWARIEVRTKVPQAKTVTANAEFEPPAKETKEPEMPPINTQPVPQKATANVTPLERIGGLSQQVLAIIQTMHQLAADIEAVAIEVEEQMEKIEKDTILLRQFQQFLKGMQQ